VGAASSRDFDMKEGNISRLEAAPTAFFDAQNSTDPIKLI
jgi:hypothetical protein